MVSGSGTSGDPYVLSSFSDLELLGTAPYTLDKYFRLGSDIDASPTQDAGYNDGAGWLPRGTLTAQFDGNNKSITGLYINRNATDNVGLFSIIQGATVKDLYVTTVNIIGRANTGVIAGRADTATFNNVTTSGSVSGTSYVGGVVGIIVTGTSSYTYCYSYVDVTASAAYSGGLIGGTAAGSGTITINNSYYNSDLSGYSYVGGIIGTSTITLDISTVGVEGTITATNVNIGGVAGAGKGEIQEVSLDSSLIFSLSTSASDGVGGIIGMGTGSLTLHDLSVKCDITAHNILGGIFGNTNNGAWGVTIYDVYYEGDLSGASTIGGVIGQANCTSGATIYDSVTVKGTIYGSGNSIGGVAGYHRGTIQNIVIDSNLTFLTNSSYGERVGGIVGQNYGQATYDNCLVLTDIPGKNYIGGIVGSSANGAWTVTITNCIYNGDITGATYLGGIAGQLSHVNGGSLTDNKASGSITSTGGTIGGCFGLCAGNLTRCVTVDMTISTPNTVDQVGGIAGTYQGAGGTIDSCINYANLSARDYVGGIIGSTVNNASNYIIKNCKNYGEVTGRNYIAGIIAYNVNTGGSSVVSNCIAYSGVITSSNNYSGGIVAYSTRPVLNCYSLVAVAGTYHSGGLVGRMESNTITNSYSKGAVTGTSNIGGLVGSKNTGTASDSFWDTQTSNQANSALGTGKTTAEMQTQDTYTNWDFTTPIWIIESDHNKGYPYLFYVKYLDSSISAAASLSASLTVTSSQVIQELGGIISAQSSIGGDLKINMAIAGAVTSSSSTTSTINRVFNLASILGGVGSNSANLSRITLLFSESIGVSTISGILKRGLNLDSEIHGAVNTTGELSREINLDSEIIGGSTALGVLGRVTKVFSDITGNSSVNGMLSNIRRLQGGVNSYSIIEGSLRYTAILRGTVTGVGRVTASLSREMLISGTVIGTGYISAILTYILNFKDVFCNVTFKTSKIKYKIVSNNIKTKLKQSKIIFRILE